MKEAISKLNFWAYDVFGYLIPGFFFLFCSTKANSYFEKGLGFNWNSATIAELLIISIFSYVVGHIIAALSSFLLERLFFRHLFDYPTHYLFNDKQKKWYIKILFPGYFRPYSKTFQQKFIEKFKSTFQLDDLNDKHDIFWMVWNYVAIKNPIAYKRANHFLELYGYSRNISMSFLLMIPFTWLPGWTNFINGYLWSFSSMIIAGVMFINYTKLIRRLNDEIYRAFMLDDYLFNFDH